MGKDLASFADREAVSLSDIATSAIFRLIDHCRHNDWAGIDPYDALNSKLFARTPFHRSKLCRIAFTQVMKRLPINLRPLLDIRKEANPKAIALFLKSFLMLSRHGIEVAEFVPTMLNKLEELSSAGFKYAVWGYNFPWQTRTILVPKGAPNVVCTSFVADALLDAYDLYRDSRYCSMAVSAAQYLLNELYCRDGSIASFSYPMPGLQSRVHNANLLAAALLARVYKYTGDRTFLEPALCTARYAAGKQERDGSWYYGEAPTQHWIDNFHTGYNLCALRSIGQNLRTAEFEGIVRHGFHFYRHHFFEDDAVPKYFHNRVYPVDIHCVAQSIITLIALHDIGDDNVRLASNVLNWVMSHMWDEEGYFHYQFRKSYKIRISYMRWSQAWMLLALATIVDSST